MILRGVLSETVFLHIRVHVMGLLSNIVQFGRCTGILCIALFATGCAPYRSSYYMQAGIAPFTRLDGSRSSLAGRFAVAPLELGAVEGGVRPGWSVTIHP